MYNNNNNILVSITITITTVHCASQINITINDMLHANVTYIPQYWERI